MTKKKHNGLDPEALRAMDPATREAFEASYQKHEEALRRLAKL